jgi:hypothetical protein
LLKGFISKTDFQGDVNKILANNTIADKSKFIISKIKIGKTELTGVEAIVVKDQKVPIRIGETILNKIGKFKVDKEKSKLIFE